jgi:hypothetical protein
MVQNDRLLEYILTYIRGFTLQSSDDMASIMDPPIDEICGRIGQHLSGLELQVCRSREGHQLLQLTTIDCRSVGEMLRCVA